MSKLKALEQTVSALSHKELAEFRRWFSKFDAANWDRQIERDMKAGKLDELADEATRRRFVPRDELLALVRRAPLDRKFKKDIAAALDATIDEL